MLQLTRAAIGKPSPAPAAAGILLAALGLIVTAWNGTALDRRPETAPRPPAPAPAQHAPASARAPLPGPYRVRVLRVIDGDTFEAVVRVWFGQDVTTLVRLRNVDAPELKAQCPAEARLAESARAALADTLGSGHVHLHDLGLDKYGGRIVASVSITPDARRPEGQSPEDVGAMLIAGGYARAYDGRKRASWCASQG